MGGASTKMTGRGPAGRGPASRGLAFPLFNIEGGFSSVPIGASLMVTLSQRSFSR